MVTTSTQGHALPAPQVLDSARSAQLPPLALCARTGTFSPLSPPVWAVVPFPAASPAQTQRIALSVRADTIWVVVLAAPVPEAALPVSLLQTARFAHPLPIFRELTAFPVRMSWWAVSPAQTIQLAWAVEEAIFFQEVHVILVLILFLLVLFAII